MDILVKYEIDNKACAY